MGEVNHGISWQRTFVFVKRWLWACTSHTETAILLCLHGSTTAASHWLFWVMAAPSEVYWNFWQTITSQRSSDIVDALAVSREEEWVPIVTLLQARQILGAYRRLSRRCNNTWVSSQIYIYNLSECHPQCCITALSRIWQISRFCLMSVRRKGLNYARLKSPLWTNRHFASVSKFHSVHDVNAICL